MKRKIMFVLVSITALAIFGCQTATQTINKKTYDATGKILLEETNTTTSKDGSIDWSDGAGKTLLDLRLFNLGA